MDLRPSAPVEVKLPSGDRVWLRARLSPRGGMMAAAVIKAAQRDGIQDIWNECEAQFGWAFMQTEIVDWTFRDKDGDKLPITRANLELLDWETEAFYIADKTTSLYGEEALRPLVRRVQTSSDTGQTDDSTSPSPSSTKKPRKPTTPSSPPDTADTEP